MPEACRAEWRKSSRSSANGQCVEVRDRGDAIDLRDSKNPTDAIITFSRAEWAAFLAGVEAGEFSLH